MLYLALGANLGDREANLRHALRLLEARIGPLQRCSSFMETAPAGMNSEHAFLNAAASFETTLSPEAVLRITQEIERELGRTTKSSNGQHFDRPIDIDLLQMDAHRLHTPTLTLPHPELRLRDFVLRPLAEIAPEATYEGFYAAPLSVPNAVSCATSGLASSIDGVASPAITAPNAAIATPHSAAVGPNDSVAVAHAAAPTSLAEAPTFAQLLQAWEQGIPSTPQPDRGDWLRVCRLLRQLSDHATLTWEAYLQLCEALRAQRLSWHFIYHRSEGCLQLAAMASLGYYPCPTGTKAWLEDVVVDAAFRHRGYGRRLVEWAQREAQRRGAQKLLLTSRPERLAANALYRSSGFALRTTNVYELRLDAKSRS